MKRIVTIQDISCVGKCSLTVALPIISAMGVEAAILPTAVLSTHTAFKKGFTVHDLSGEITPITAPTMYFTFSERFLTKKYIPKNKINGETKYKKCHTDQSLKTMLLTTTLCVYYSTPFYKICENS